MSILKDKETILQSVVAKSIQGANNEKKDVVKISPLKRKSFKRKKKKSKDALPATNTLFYRKMLKFIDYDNATTLSYNINAIIDNNEEKEARIFLKKFIKSSENEIKIVSRDNYETFISFGEQLNRLKFSATQIQRSLSSLSENLLQSSSAFIKEFKTLDKYYTISRNIEKTITMIYHLIFTFKQIQKLKYYIETNKSPLLIYKLMIKIENTYFTNINHFRMIKKIQNIIDIKKKSMGNVLIN